MKKIVLALVILWSAVATAQPTPPQPGITKVVHGASLTGSGIPTVPLDVRTSPVGGLISGSSTVGVSLRLDCSSTQVLAWSGTSWACAANGTGNLLGTLSTGKVPVASGAHTLIDGWPTDDGTTWGVGSKFTITESTGATSIFGALNMNSHLINNVTDPVSAQDAVTLHYLTTSGIGGVASNVIPKGTGTGLTASGITDTGTAISTSETVQLAGAVGINATPAAGTARLIVSPIATTSTSIYSPSALTANTVGHTEFYANDTGTYDTTGSQVAAIGIRTSLTATRSAGANALNNYGVYSDVTGGQTNYGYYSPNGNFFSTGTLQNTGNVSINATPSASTALNIVTTAANGVGVDVTDSTTGQTATRYMYRVDKTGSLDTTAGALSSIGYYSNVASTRSAGSNGLTNYGGYFSATGAQSNYSVYGVNGVMFNAGPIQGGSTITAAGANNSNSIFSTAAGTAQTALIAAVNAANSGTFDTTSAPNTTYAVYGSVSATRSAGANGLTNVAAHFQATGAQTNIALETTTGIVTFNGTVGLNTQGSASTRLYNEAASADSIGYYFHNANTASTVTSRAALQVNDVGTYDTTAAVATLYGVRVSNTASRSAGANALTDYGFYADITGAQSNYGVYVNSGLTHLGGATDISSTLAVTGGATFSSFATVAGTGGSNSFTVGASSTAQASNIAAAAIGNTATFDTTATNRIAYGARIINTASISTGANILTDYGVYVDVSGATSNYAFYGNNGLMHNQGAVDFASTLSVGGALNMTTHLINNVVDPVSAQDAATKNYVDTHSGGLSGGATNKIPLWSSSTTITNSHLLDDSTNFDVQDISAIQHFRVVLASGNTTIGGTLTADSGNRVFDLAGTGLTSSANTVSLNMSGASCSAGSFVSAISATGSGTCTAASGSISGLTTGVMPVATSSTTIGNGHITDSTNLVASEQFSIATGSSVSYTGLSNNYVESYSTASGIATLAANSTGGATTMNFAVSNAATAVTQMSITTSTTTVNNALSIVGALAATSTSTFAGLARFGGGTDTSAIGNNPVMVTNAGTTALAVRDSTNDVEVYLSASKPGVTGFGILGTSTAHALQLLANNTLGITISTTGGVTAANDLTVQNNTTLGLATSNKTTIVGRSYSSSAVSLGTCTNGSISGDDQAFTVSFSGVNSTCTVNFNATSAWASTPVCALTPGGTGTGWTPSGGPFITSQSTTAITFASGANGSAPIFVNGNCNGRTH